MSVRMFLAGKVEFLSAVHELPGSEGSCGQSWELAGTDAVFRNWVGHFKPLAPVSFPPLRLAAHVVLLVRHGLPYAAPQQPHVVAVRAARSTHVLPQPATSNYI